MGERRKPEVLRLTESVDAWFLENEVEIAMMMEKYRKEWFEFTKSRSNVMLDPAMRTLSEMPICWSLEMVLEKFPLGDYRYVSPRNGAVRVGEKLCGAGSTLTIGHGFLQNEKDGVVACTTFGQFVSPFVVVPPGGRVARVAELAPQLLVRGNGGLAMLRGRADEISSKLGLEYQKRKNHR